MISLVNNNGFNGESALTESEVTPEEMAALLKESIRESSERANDIQEQITQLQNPSESFSVTRNSEEIDKLVQALQTANTELYAQMAMLGELGEQLEAANREKSSTYPRGRRCLLVFCMGWMGLLPIRAKGG